MNGEEASFRGPLVFLGRGAAFNPLEGNTAAYIREGDRLFLVDCGETVFERLIARQALTGVTELYIAISHLHSDHCGSLGTLLYYCRFALGIRARIVLPREETAYIGSVRRLLELFGIPEDFYSCADPGEVAGFRAFSAFRYVKTAHDPRMECFSFELETPEGGVFYSADTCRTDEMAAFIQRHGKIAAIYMEALETDTPGSIHLPLDRLRAALPDALMEKTRLMHLSGAGCVRKAREMGFSIVEA